MLTQPTIEKLKELRLDAMAEAWLEQQKKPLGDHPKTGQR